MFDDNAFSTQSFLTDSWFFDELVKLFAPRASKKDEKITREECNSHQLVMKRTPMTNGRRGKKTNMHKRTNKQWL